MNYNTCPYCGDHLDFGERCDCQQRKGAAETGEDGEELQQQAERHLGSEIRPSELEAARAYAERKLAYIIDREGDANGARRQPDYLAQLIAETVRGSRLSRCLNEINKLRELQAQGTKKDSPCQKTQGRLSTTPIVPQQLQECNRRIQNAERISGNSGSRKRPDDYPAIPGRAV